MLLSSPVQALRVTLLAYLLMPLALLAAPPARANLIGNGSFESGPSPGEAMPVAMGSTAITNWTVTRAAIDYVGTLWNAHDGSRSLGLNGTSPGGIAQAFATVPGSPYEVRFQMAGDAFSDPVLKHMRVAAAGQSQDYEFDASHSWPWGMGWLEKIFSFTANAGSTTLEFCSLDAGNTGPALDNVVVTGQSAVGVPPGGPAGLALAPPLPNPAPSFRVDFVVPFDMPLRLSVWDIQGREIAVLAEGRHPAGRFARVWDGSIQGGHAAAGVYVIRLAAPGATLARKAVLTR